MKVKYRGFRDGNGVACVMRDQDEPHLSQHAVLDSAPSLALRNHSPTGFEWGYAGSGPAQLALAMLLDATGDQEIAQAMYQRYKFDVVGNLDQTQPWTISADSVKEWVRKETARQLAKEAAHPTTAEHPEEAGA